MAVAFDADTAAVTLVASAATMTVSNLTVGSGSNRAMAIMLWWHSATIPTGISVTWDSGGTNQAMTLVSGTQDENGANTTSCQLYGLIAPTSGNKSLVVNWTGNLEAYATAISFTGVDQTSVAVAFPHGTKFSNTTAVAGPNSITITSAVGNMVMAGHQNSNGGAWGAISDTTIATDHTGASFNTAFNYGSGAATKTMTAAWTGTDIWGSYGCDVLAAGGAVTITMDMWFQKFLDIINLPTDIVGY